MAHLLLSFMRKLLTLGALALATLAACGSSRSTTDSTDTTAVPAAKAGPDYSAFAVDFMPTDILSEAIDRAAAEDKLVFIDFYTTWCLPCKLMDEDVFTDPEFGRYMNDNFVSLKIDAERGNGVNLASLYEVQAYPTLLFVDTRGRVVGKKQGAAYQRELREMGDAAIATVP